MHRGIAYNRHSQSCQKHVIPRASPKGTSFGAKPEESASCMPGIASAAATTPNILQH